MKWRVVEYDNAISERGMQVVSDDGTIICCNEPYYPTALDPRHAHLIAAAPAMLEALKGVRALVTEAAMTGFRWDDGDWADRLFRNQAILSSAIAAAEAQP